MPKKAKFLIPILICTIALNLIFSPFIILAASRDSYAFIILSKYSETLDIGEEFYLVCLSSNGKKPTFKSSDSKVASVNTYGKVVAKKAGSAVITSKIKDAEASCEVIVRKTEITLSKTSASIEHNETLKLTASTSNNSTVCFKSNKKSIATVEEDGTVTGIKPGEAIITATADGSSKTCKITVKSPTIKLSNNSITLQRSQSIKLTATVSSGIKPTWKINKKSVALVDQDGTVTALKHGTAIITATVDDVSKICEVIVEKPVITLSQDKLTLEVGNSATLLANVSSGNKPEWSCSNSNIISIDQNGHIIALQKGKAYAYASEDGTKVKCTIYVTETVESTQ